MNKKKRSEYGGEREIHLNQQNTEPLRRKLPVLNDVEKENITKRAQTQTIDLYNVKIDQRVLKLVSKKFAKDHVLIPLGIKSGNLVVAMKNPNDFSAINELRLKTNLRIETRRANADDIEQLIAREYPSNFEVDDLLQNVNVTSSSDERGRAQNEEEAGPIIKLVRGLIIEAVDLKASDIHFDCREKDMVVRIRIDGELRNLSVLPKNVQNSVLSRLKIISDLDITETRVPQDGRAMMQAGNKIVDLRVSVLPTIHGEKVVIRILDRANGIRKLDDFNFNAKSLKEFRHLLNLPHGIFLVTGPTGSGKSSTLYAALNELNKTNVNIITVEDPVEYQLEGVNQVLVNSEVGLTFAQGLRSILRQDPNIVMVGEIRDSETAEIAIRASMTGHLVLSTLHTNDSIGTINRLFDMGIDSFLVGSSLSGVLSQRLVRTICSNCKERVPVSTDENIFLKRNGKSATVLYKGRGCAKCNYTGFQGRMAVQELLTISSDIRLAITKGATSDELAKIARKEGMNFLLEDGLDKVIEGYTTIEEILRVVAEE
ncbi:MAG: GspE/PulE family protein [Lactobacillales bacterium]|nr:GspE/PulE family protein [Lactobacillales bacterium]